MLESDYEEAIPICATCGGKTFPSSVWEDGKQVDRFVCRNNPNHTPVDIDSESVLRCECGERSVRNLLAINEFVCKKNPIHRIRRIKEKNYDYLCMATVSKKMMFDQEDGKIIVGCTKLCALTHCPRKPKDCLITEDMDESRAINVCLACKSRKNCKCRMDTPVSQSCLACKFEARFLCGMHPYAIDFGSDYKNARCPVPGCNGKLEKKRQNSFETFIRERYEHDEAFADHFRREMKNTLDIKAILQFNNNQ